MQLPDRELTSGISEIIKYGLIRDAALFEWLEVNMDKVLARDPVATAYAIEQSCVNKAEVVALDEREVGVRATLNLGHTFGHAIATPTGTKVPSGLERLPSRATCMSRSTWAWYCYTKLSVLQEPESSL